MFFDNYLIRSFHFFFFLINSYIIMFGFCLSGVLILHIIFVIIVQWSVFSAQWIITNIIGKTMLGPITLNDQNA